MPIQRPHYKERIAHAEGHEVEFRFDDTHQWQNAGDPQWYDDHQYRIKKDEKPDRNHELFVAADEFHLVAMVEDFDTPNLSLTFDGKTGELKSAKVI